MRLRARMTGIRSFGPHIDFANHGSAFWMWIDFFETDAGRVREPTRYSCDRLRTGARRGREARVSTTIYNGSGDALLMVGGLVFLLSYSLSCEGHVAVENGNVVYADNRGTAYRLTDSGRDSEPTLSADGREVAFVRAMREVAGIGIPRVVQSELWTVGTERSSKPKRLYSGPARMPDGRQSSAFWTPKFSPDKRYVYFLSDYSATSAALFRLDLASGAAYFLSPASEYDVLQSGRHRGSIIASIRTASEPDSEGITYPIYPYFLLDPNGKKLLRVADEKARLDDVISKFQR